MSLNTYFQSPQLFMQCLYSPISFKNSYTLREEEFLYTISAFESRMNFPHNSFHELTRTLLNAHYKELSNSTIFSKSVIFCKK